MKSISLKQVLNEANGLSLECIMVPLKAPAEGQVKLGKITNVKQQKLWSLAESHLQLHREVVKQGMTVLSQRGLEEFHNFQNAGLQHLIVTKIAKNAFWHEIIKGFKINSSMSITICKGWELYCSSIRQSDTSCDGRLFFI